MLDLCSSILLIWCCLECQYKWRCGYESYRTTYCILETTVFHSILSCACRLCKLVRYSSGLDTAWLGQVDSRTFDVPPQQVLVIQQFDCSIDQSDGINHFLQVGEVLQSVIDPDYQRLPFLYLHLLPVQLHLVALQRSSQVVLNSATQLPH